MSTVSLYAASQPICCVESTVRDAFQRDSKVFVVGDATGELDPSGTSSPFNHAYPLRGHCPLADMMVSGPR